MDLLIEWLNDEVKGWAQYTDAPEDELRAILAQALTEAIDLEEFAGIVCAELQRRGYPYKQ